MGAEMYKEWSRRAERAGRATTTTVQSEKEATCGQDMYREWAQEAHRGGRSTSAGEDPRADRVRLLEQELLRVRHLQRDAAQGDQESNPPISSRISDKLGRLHTTHRRLNDQFQESAKRNAAGRRLNALHQLFDDLNNDRDHLDRLGKLAEAATKTLQTPRSPEKAEPISRGMKPRAWRLQLSPYCGSPQAPSPVQRHSAPSLTLTRDEKKWEQEQEMLLPDTALVSDQVQMLKRVPIVSGEQRKTAITRMLMSSLHD
eukprot:TRINITY_DN5270_c0_g1_i1.p1 TRINITY_DN5270_c0_g1~~TRINITY_DN5270_c0_g1_i1.p1  ORF type:complete len:258 (-),score=54.68 TRINITY_DN5270_c0_g1_i1:388-1161(-)